MTGIAFKNIPFLTQILYIDSDWSKFFRKMALTIVLMRAGMGLDPVALRKTKVHTVMILQKIAFLLLYRIIYSCELIVIVYCHNHLVYILI